MNHAGGKVPLLACPAEPVAVLGNMGRYAGDMDRRAACGASTGDSACDMAAGCTCWIVPTAGKDPYVNKDWMKRAVALADAVAE